MLQHSLKKRPLQLKQYNPFEELKKLTTPVLIVQEATDIQASEQEGKNLAACNPKAVFELIPGMNHVLKNSSLERKENMTTYSNATLPVNKNLIQAIVLLVSKINQ